MVTRSQATWLAVDPALLRLNGDLKPDLAVANGNDVSVLLNQSPLLTLLSWYMPPRRRHCSSRILWDDPPFRGHSEQPSSSSLPNIIQNCNCRCLPPMLFLDLPRARQSWLIAFSHWRVRCDCPAYDRLRRYNASTATLSDHEWSTSFRSRLSACALTQILAVDTLHSLDGLRMESAKPRC